MNLITLEVLQSKDYGSSVRKCADTSSNLFARKELSKTASALDARRFAEEVTILSKLDHPCVIKVIDYKLGEAENYFVMPWYAMSLRQLFSQQDNSIDLQDVQRIFLAVLDGVEYAHSQGVLHRDIKPENILLGFKDDVVVSDFGLGLQVTHSKESRLTKLSRGEGIEWYVAPEQAEALHNATVRSDIFSLGRVLSEFFVKRNPSGAVDLEAIPLQYRRIVEKCLSFRQAARYSSVTELKSVFRLASASHDRHSELHELREFAITSSSQLTDARVTYLSHLLHDYSDDEREMTSFFMSADESLIHRLEHSEEAQFSRSIETWLLRISYQRHPFDYTDKLANRLKRIFDVLQNATLKARTLSAIIRIACSHNRYYVLRLASKTISNIKGVDLSDAISTELAHLTEIERQTIANQIELENIPIGLRFLLRRAA